MIGEVSRDATPGAFVLVLGKEGTPFGWGLWNPKSRMPLRVVSHSLAELEDESFFETAIRRAAHIRREILKLDAETDSYRAIHGDADFMPGIVVEAHLEGTPDFDAHWQPTGMAEYRLSSGEPITVHANGDMALPAKALVLRRQAEVLQY